MSAVLAPRPRPNARGDRPRPYVRRKAVAYRMLEFVRPDAYWPTPYSVEQAFGVMRAAIASARGVHDVVQWRGPLRTTLVDHLHGTGGVGYGYDEGVAVGSIDDLRKLFARLVLGRLHPPIEAWREAAGVGPGGTFVAAFPHHPPFAGAPLQGDPRASEADVVRHLGWLLRECRGRRLAVSLNPCHLQAREVGAVTARVTPRGFRFDLSYVLDGSSWTETLARTRGDETFVGTLDRAVDRMRLLLGEGIDDPAALCLALNRSDNLTGYETPRESYWVLGRAGPVQQGAYGREPLGRFVGCSRIGYGRGALAIAELPTGRVVARDASYDRERMEALRDVLEARFPAGSPVPTGAEVEAIKAAETTEVGPSHDAEGRYLFDRDGEPLSAEALARGYVAPADEEVDPACLF